MKNIFILLFLFISLTGFSSILKAQNYYEVTPLGGSNLTGRAINNNGQVAGTDDPNHSAFIWENDSTFYIPDTRWGDDINSSGYVTGGTYQGSDVYAYIYKDGQMIYIPPISGNLAVGNGINDSSWITGNTKTNGGTELHPFLYKDGVMIDLGSPGDWGWGRKINNSGWVVGRVKFSGDSLNVPFVYKGTSLEQLQLLGGSAEGEATDINEAGEVCGWNEMLATFLEQAVKWDQSGNVISLEQLPNQRWSMAYGINNSGDIVGSIHVEGVGRFGVLWKGDSLTVLNNLIDPQSGINLTDGFDINDAGEILCSQTVGNAIYYYVITPPPSADLIVNETGDESDADLTDEICDVDLQQSGNQCTCRAAIEQANYNAGDDIITFDIPGGGIPTITPGSALPEINTTITIDGTTQPGSGMVELNGINAGGSANGLNISADNCEIRGLIINRFGGDGIIITGDGNTIVGNIIGTDKNSATGLGNGGNGVSIINGSNNIIGNPAADELNVIAGNSDNGIFITGGNASGNWIKSNYIGTDTLGFDGFEDSEAGILILDASGYNKIGIGLQQLQNMPYNPLGLSIGNVIDRNNIAIKILNTNNTEIIGNIVGLFKTPFGNTLTKLGSALEGILIKNSMGTNVSECTIGGTGGDGIRISGELSVYNKIFNSYIGTDSSGTLDIGCEGNGICIDSLAKGNSIGGCGSDSSVTIAGNSLNGILLNLAALQQTTDTLFNNIRNTKIGVIQNISPNKNGNQSVSFLKIPTGLNGIKISNSLLTVVGEALWGNNIAGNALSGILMEGTQSKLNRILANNIGTTSAGNEDVGNEGSGILIKDGANNNVIGGELQNMMNTISGNLLNGITIDNANNNKIIGNLMGLFRQDNNQYVRLGNSGNGLLIKKSFANLVGKCLIGANAVNGIQITGLESKFNKLFGLIIGSDSSASSGLGNESNGISIDDNAGANTIGGVGQDSSVSIVGSQKYAIFMFNLLLDLVNKVQNTQMGVIRNISPSSENPTEFLKIPNNLGGICMENVANTLIGGSGDDVGNIISGNNGAGITLKGFSTAFNKLYSNIIGTDSIGTSNLGNLGAGIKLLNGAHDNEIGGENSEESNVCVSSSSGTGISLSNTYNNKITHLLSGVFNDGQTLKVLSNNIGMLINNATETVIKSSIFSGNNSDGVKITGTGSSNISLNASYIGTDSTGTMNLGNGGDGINILKASNVDFSGAKVIINSNEGYGINADITHNLNLGSVWAGVDAETNLSTGYKNRTGAVKVTNSWGLSLGVGTGYNIFAGYDSTAVEVSNSSGIIERNSILSGKVGIKATIDSLGGSMFNNLSNVANYSLIIQRNIIRNCGRAIQADDVPFIYIAGNLIDQNIGIGSGIHLFNSSGIIEGNSLTNDAGDAIYLEDGSDPVMNKNNIFNNDGFGLINADPNFMVNAENNWWGDPSGPGGSGPGNGDEVSDYVNYQNWRTELVSLVVIGAPDTIYQSPAVTDTLLGSVLNWENPTDVVDITLTDSLGWLTGQTSFTVTIDDSLGASFPIIVSVPGGATSNTINKVFIDAVSQINSNQTDSDEFYVITYTPEIVRIVIAPDSVGLTVGDSLQFTAAGYDQFNQPVSFTPDWSAVLGTIDNSGLYVTPSISGIDTVTVMESNTELTDDAIVVVGNPTGIKNEKPVLPTEYALYQNYPNPFNPSTVIRFALPEAGNVVLEIYNILGQRVARLVNEEMNAGYHEVNFNAQSLASGIYLYKITAGGFSQIKKMVLIK